MNWQYEASSQSCSVEQVSKSPCGFSLEIESDLRRVTVQADLRGAAHSFEHLRYVCVCERERERETDACLDGKVRERYTERE